VKTEQLMTKNVRTCIADDVLAIPARIMWEQDCGCVPVVSSDGSGLVVGMLTDRDICMAALMQGGKLEEILVASAMSTDLQTCQPSHTLSEAEQLMSRAQVRRLPVVDDAGQLLGLISMADIAGGSAGMRGISKKAIPKRDVADTLAAIIRPRGVEAPPPAPTPARSKKK
jgi:CBS domain-containing protein